MKIRQMFLLALATWSLSGCVMQPSAYRGDRYEDGSYYSAGDGEGGDYYYAPRRSDDSYPPGGYYGLGYPGYCPVRYRYCPTWFGFGGGWALRSGWLYEPYYDPWVRAYPRRHDHRRPPTRPIPPPVNAQGPWSSPAPGRQAGFPSESGQPGLDPEPSDNGGGQRRRARPESSTE